jgi:histidine triad (HIT) family protein
VSDPNCIFCKVVARDLPAQIVDEDERMLASMDINPATRGHLIVIPPRHSRDPVSTCSIPAARPPGRRFSTSIGT